MKNYYHAGAMRRNSTGETLVDWSNQTRMSLDAARREARGIAAQKESICGNAWCAIVEWWDKSHGLRPGQDVAAGSEQEIDGQWMTVS